MTVGTENKVSVRFCEDLRRESPYVVFRGESGVGWGYSFPVATVPNGSESIDITTIAVDRVQGYRGPCGSVLSATGESQAGACCFVSPEFGQSDTIVVLRR